MNRPVVEKNLSKVSFENFSEAVSERLKIDKNKLAPEALWVKDIGISSVDIVKIVMLFRQKFGVKVPSTAAGKIKTVQDAYQLLESGANNGK